MAKKIGYRTFRDFEEVFVKNFDFSAINIHFSEFSQLSIDIAEAHARGFGPL